MTTVRGIVIDRWIHIPAPNSLPNGTEVLVTLDTSLPEDNDDGPMSPEEIARVLAAMRRLQPAGISDDISEGFEKWEQENEQISIRYAGGVLT